MADFLFGLVVFISHVIHGITGFAGTMLAMPPGIVLVGYAVAKPVLNLLGLLAAIYIALRERRKILWREIVRAVFVMGLGICAANLLARKIEIGHSKIMYVFLGLFLIVYAAVCLYRLRAKSTSQKHTMGAVASGGMLFLAGVIHGLYVSGGPFLSAYMANKSTDKDQFRATISMIWVFMNGIILAGDIQNGAWNTVLLTKLIYIFPCFLFAMALGTYLCRRVSQKTFLLLTYILFFVSGGMLLFT